MGFVQTPHLHSQPAQGEERGALRAGDPASPAPAGLPCPLTGVEASLPACPLSRVFLCWVRPSDPPSKEPLQRPRLSLLPAPQYLPPAPLA